MQIAGNEGAEPSDFVSGFEEIGPTIPVIMQAAAADRTPLCESSKARHDRGSTPKSSAALRKGSGAGLPTA